MSEDDPKVTLNDALLLSKDLLVVLGREMGKHDQNIAFDVYMFAIHRALAGMAVVGFGMSHSKLPSDDDLELFVVLYRAHLKDARIMEQQSDGTVN